MIENGHLIKNWNKNSNLNGKIVTFWNVGIKMKLKSKFKNEMRNVVKSRD